MNQEQPYFYDFEDVIPPKPVVKTLQRKWFFRFLSILYLCFAFFYFYWRYSSLVSFNGINLWHFFIMLAELLLFVGSVFRIMNYWSYRDLRPQKPVKLLSEIEKLKEEEKDRPISIAIFIASHNESKDLLEQTFIDVQKIKYPYREVSINAYLLDDGQRPELSSLCAEHGITYLGKTDNIGFKAGNLNNAFSRTNEDLILILDADTRPFPNILGHLTGYFRNAKTGWVQTPQWYYDLSRPMKPSEYGHKILGNIGKWILKPLEWISLKKLYLNKDIYASNPQFFYDAILRNRNAFNTVFSCGAGSVFRRKALESYCKKTARSDRPFAHHISEDIFTSLLLHDKTDFHSVYHHYIECKMLSPQDTESWVKQQTRYASGAIDIGINHNPLFKRGLSTVQKALYFSIPYSYFTPLLSIFFFSIPLLYFFLGIPSIPEISEEFLIVFSLYQSLNLSVFVLANWGISTKRPDQKFWSSFTYVTQSWLKVLTGKELLFNVTRKNVEGSKKSFKIVSPHMIVMLLMILAPLYALAQRPSYPWHFEELFYLFWCVYFIFQLNQFVRMWIWDRVRNVKR